MKKLFWFVFGIAGGFVLAHLMDKDPRGHELLAEVDSRISEFTDRIGDAYREQEAKISGVVDEVKTAAVDAVANARSSAPDAARTAPAEAAPAPMVPATPAPDAAQTASD